MRVARDTGQPVLVIARQSFALTLYTLWHLQQWHRYDLFEHEMMQHNVASLTAHAVHDPKALNDLRERFVAEHRQRSTIEVVDSMRRVRDLVAAHQRLTPIENS